MADSTFSVYLAGKIARCDWRHQLFDGLTEASVDYETQGRPAQDLMDGRFLYNGPFFIEGQHGDAHGRSTHGQGQWQTQRVVTSACSALIALSDAMFCWVDDPSAYGTIAEIGYAAALHIPVAFYEPPHSAELQEDMWFAKTLATYSRVMPTAADAWADFKAAFADDVSRYELIQARIAKQESKGGYVYVIRAETGEFKIGKTKSIRDRMNFFGVKLPFTWQMIHTIPSDNMHEAEARLHRMFARNRTNGEWFNLSEADVKVLKSISHMTTGEVPL